MVGTEFEVGASLGTESALAGRTVAEAVADTVRTPSEGKARKRARLRVYLGYAPGVGKTYAMLSEGQRARAGNVEAHRSILAP